MADPRTAAEMRALAEIKHDEAQVFHARADEAGERLADLVSRAISLATGTLKPGPCPTCGHVQADADLDPEIADARFAQRRFAGQANQAGTLAMFWSGCADRKEAAEAAQSVLGGDR